MSKAPIFTPDNNAYVQFSTQYQQLINNFERVDLAAANVSADIDPFVLLDGSGLAYLLGQITIDSSPSANMHLCDLPETLIPVTDYILPVTVLRSGTAIPNAIKVYSNGSAISSVTITSPGSYATMPTLSTTGPGFGAVLSPRASVVGAAPAAAGTGYAPNNTITFTGGTSTTAAIVTINNTKLVGVSVNGLGNGYQPADIIVLAAADGTVSVRPAVTLTSVQLVIIQVQAGGSGYSVGNTITLSGGTSTTAAIVTVSAVSGGAVTAVTVTNRGDYTVAPSTFSQASTSGSGTGAVFHNCEFAPKSWTISTPGIFTANPTNFTQFSTTGSGVGATWNTPVIGVNAVSPTTPGNYSVLPTSPVAQGSTSGSGTGATFTVLWGLITPVVSSGGAGYTSTSGLAINGGGGTGGGAGTLNLSANASGKVELMTQPQTADVVCFATAPMLLKPYS